MTGVQVRADKQGGSGTLTSPAVNTALGVFGLIVPAVAWIVEQDVAQKALLVVETLVVVGLSARLLWLRRAFIQLRRADARTMSDPRYFEAIRGELEATLIHDFDEIADGNLHVYASEVPRISVMLYRVLMEAGCEPRRVVATDLTTNPGLLVQRHEYLSVNQRLVEAGGMVRRVFICRTSDLVRKQFAADLMKLAALHRSLGVQCGLVTRESLSPDHAVDFVVVGRAAVLIEEEQGDERYGVGRSSISFKYAEKWERRFEAVWNPLGEDSAPSRLRRYADAVKPMFHGSWRPSVAKAALEPPTPDRQG
ncbi:MAG: hypothetical protein ACRDTU_22765, partial [Micromonosporaceae bacterium]